MPEMTQQHTLHGKTYTFCSFSGEVIGANRERETKITGSGGGGTNVSIDPINITTETTVHNEFFLVDEEGNEKFVHLINWKIPTRTSHYVQMIWLLSPKGKELPFIQMVNKNLKLTETANGVIWDIASRHYQFIKWGAIVGSVVLGLICSSWSAFFVVLIIGFGFYLFKSKQLQKDIANIATEIRI